MPPEAKATEFNQAVADCVDGTAQDTIHKNNLRVELIAMLDMVAADVVLTAQGNGEFITSAGFRLASSNRVARLK